MGLRRGFVLCGVILAAGGVALAATTTRLDGTVVDRFGTPLPGVTVEIASEALIGGPQTAVTDDRGEVAFHLLPVGVYEVAATLAGFRPASGEVRLRLDRVGAITLRMARAEFAGEIEVTAEVPVIDTTQVGTGQVFGREYLANNLVSLYDRHYRYFIYDAPGVQGERALGSLESENYYTLDGLDLAITNFPFDAVEEVSVNTSGFEAEHGLATGAVVNVVTRSGGNSFSGVLDLRYRDQNLNEAGDHYDPDTDVSSYKAASASLGGPLLRDRLWFFASVRKRVRESSPETTTVTRRFDVLEQMAKLTWAAGESTRVAAMYSADPCDIDNFDAEWAWYAAPEAHGFQDQGGSALQAELQSVLGDNLLLTVGAGTYEYHVDQVPQSGDLETPAGWDIDRALLFGNFDYASYSDQGRDHLRAELTWLGDGPAGRHEVKGGAGLELLEVGYLWFRTGGYSVDYFNAAANPEWPDSDGDGLIDTMLYRDYPFETAREPNLSEGQLQSAFLQDAWRPTANLTVRLGLRYDQAKWSNHLGATVADLSVWQPRLGFAWDLTGRGAHVLRGSWGRFMHPTSLDVPNFAAGVARGTAYYYGLEYLCGGYGICDRDTAAAVVGPELVRVDPEGDQHPFYLGWVDSLESNDTVDTLGVGTLEAPYADTLTLGYEVRLFEQTSLGLSYVEKRTRGLMEDTCRNNTWAWGQGDAPSLEDPATWPDPAGCSSWVLANLPGLWRDYRAGVLTFESRARPWLYVLASYTYSESTGTTGAQLGWGPMSSGYDLYPTTFVNMEGNVSDDLRHVVKLNGSVLLPWQVTLGVAGYYQSAPALSVSSGCLHLHNASPEEVAELARLGVDYDEVVQFCPTDLNSMYLEPRGSRRGDSRWQLDLQVGKGFTLGSVQLEALVSVVNLFSTETPTGYETDPLSPLGWGTPTSYQEPRRWEVGFRLEF